MKERTSCQVLLDYWLSSLAQAGLPAGSVRLARFDAEQLPDLKEAQCPYVGLDAFRELHTWKDVAEIFGLSDVVVVTRPPCPDGLTPAQIPLAAREAFRYDPISESFRHASGHVLTFQRITALDISAATIRAHVAARRSIRFLVPPAVEAYIIERALYRQGDAQR